MNIYYNNESEVFELYYDNGYVVIAEHKNLRYLTQMAFEYGAEVVYYRERSNIKPELIHDPFLIERIRPV